MDSSGRVKVCSDCAVGKIAVSAHPTMEYHIPLLIVSIISSAVSLNKRMSIDLLYCKT